jgi:hypothetical protein
MILTQELKHLACRTLGLAWKFIKSGLPGYHTLRLRFFGAFLKFGKRTASYAPEFRCGGAEFLGVVCAACRERDEPSTKAGKLIRRQLDDSFGDFFDFHVGLAFILRMSGHVAAGARRSGRPPPHKVFCLWPHSLQEYSTRFCPDSAETRLAAPHLPHLTSIRVLPSVIGIFRAIASFTNRSDSSRIACFVIAGACGFLT